MNIICIAVLLAAALCGVFAHEQQFSYTITPNQFVSVVVDLGNERTVPSCISGVSSNNEKFNQCADHALLGWFLDTCAYPPLAEGTTWQFTASSESAPYINIFSGLENAAVYQIDDSASGEVWGAFNFPGYLTGSMTGGFSFKFNNTSWSKLNVSVVVNFDVEIYNNTVEFDVYAHPGCPSKPGQYAVQGQFFNGTYIVELTNEILQKYQAMNWRYFLVSPDAGSGPVQMAWETIMTYNRV